MKMRRRPAELLEVATDRSGGPEACWLWLGKLDRDGYARMTLWQRGVRAHRVAWTLEWGPIPNDLVVMHLCDNRRCVNPAHLAIGTQADNIADKVSKRRQAAGSGHAAAKLIEADIAVIRAAYAAGVTQGELGQRFGVSRDAISLIVNRRTWRHVA